MLAGAVFISVTWGINPFSAYDYAELPRTQSDAEAKGWVNMSPGTACDGKYERVSLNTCIATF